MAKTRPNQKAARALVRRRRSRGMRNGGARGHVWCASAWAKLLPRARLASAPQTTQRSTAIKTA
eukprot:14008129-Alexandrium_andersonii.AAC.1